MRVMRVTMRVIHVRWTLNNSLLAYPSQMLWMFALLQQLIFLRFWRISIRLKNLVAYQYVYQDASMFFSQAARRGS